MACFFCSLCVLIIVFVHVFDECCLWFVVVAKRHLWLVEVVWSLLIFVFVGSSFYALGCLSLYCRCWLLVDGCVLFVV